MREKLIELANDVLNYLPWGEISSHTAKEIADHLIANGVTIPVRCKDCKHYKPQEKSSCWQGRVCYCCRSAAMKVNPDGFCDRGERRTDNE